MDQIYRPGITIVGLGPGDPGLLTRQAWEILQNAGELLLRTRQHPVVSTLPESARITSFDDLFEEERDYDSAIGRVAEQVLQKGRRPQGVVYAVPGNPCVGEATSTAIARLARLEGLLVQVVVGLSFLEPVLSALRLEAFPRLALIDAQELAAAHVPSFSPAMPALITLLASRQVATGVKRNLMAVYPGEHSVRLMHAVGTGEERIEELALSEIDRSPHAGALTALYLPPLGITTSFEAFQEVIAALRAPDGCPWDREQTHQSLRSGLLEETYEVLGALDAGDSRALQEELGDLLLHIVMQAQIGAESGEFNMAGVLRSIHTKIVRRHPHVFGEEEYQGPQELLLNWERLKAEERIANGKAEASLLDGVNPTLPALLQADEYQKRAARVGFDWPDIQGVLQKLDEELHEVHNAANEKLRAAEIGDLLFAVANLARWHAIDPESALRQANQRFRGRFAYIERAARSQLSELSLDEMEALWQAAKKEE